MLMQLLNLKEMPKYLDATDGLAAALCHALQNGSPGTKKSYSSWSNFIKDNEDRIDNG